MLRVRKRKGGREFSTEHAGSAWQALRNSWSICPCLRPLCNKKKIKEALRGRRGWSRFGESNRLQMPLLERAPCKKKKKKWVPLLGIPSHPLEKRALLYCKGAPGTLWGLSMALCWGTGRIQGGPLFGPGAPSIEARTVMGALGALQGV